MKIHAPFAAVECRIFRRVDINGQIIFDFTVRGKINEPIVAGVITADESSDAAGSSSQAKIDGAIDFHAKIRIADDELKRGVVGAAREKFLGRRRALRVREIQRELPVLGEIVNRTCRAADGPELLVLLTGRRKRRQLGIT